MNRYTLSQEADRDIQEIARTTATRWGLSQAESYLADLHRTFETLARFQKIGRDVRDLRPGYWRFEHASHSVFDRHTDGGILIIRVLHYRMLPERHL